MSNLKWRKNIHSLLQTYFSKYEEDVPIIVINAIDAAYIAGLEEGKKI